jgi:hypothetical protein
MGIRVFGPGMTLRERRSSIAILAILLLAAWPRLWPIERNGFPLRGGGAGGNPMAPTRLMPDWVKQHSRPVDPALWVPDGAPPAEPTRQQVQYLLYDLRSVAPAGK